MKTRHVTIELTELEARALARFLDFAIFFADYLPNDWSLMWRMRAMVYGEGATVHHRLLASPRREGLKAALRRAWRKVDSVEKNLDGGPNGGD